MNKKSIITTLLLLTTMAGQAQENDDLLYIFPSKEVYETGEDLWFKAYLMDRQTLALSENSQTLYLLLRSESGDVVWKEKYPLKAGRGDGHVYINEKWQLGEYQMEGYTRSSFTTDSTIAILPRKIVVVNRVSQMDSISSESVKRDSVERLTAKHRFDLFPEGGNLIDGISGVVAFKATYGNGMPEDVSGVVMEDDHEIATFKSIHDGMGQFTMTPRQGRGYKVVLSDGKTYPFPNIKGRGLALRVTRNNKSGITLLVSAPDTVARPFTVLAKMRGMPCCSAQGTVRGQQKVKLPIEKFPLQGIVEITLSEGDRPTAERLVYVNPKQLLSITARTDHQQYNRRDQGKVSLKVTDPSGQPLRAELAVSIFDKACLYQPGHENILSHCFLSEEIRGNIFNPTYYFDEGNEDRLQALDLLLMTQGWRRYVWEEMSQETGVRSLETAILSDGIKGQDLVERQQFLHAFTPDSDTLMVMTDDKGRFEITPSQMDHLRGYFYLKPLVKKPKAKLTLENPFDSIALYQHARQRFQPQDFLFETHYGERDVIDGFGTVVLKETNVIGKRQQPYRDRVMEFLDSLAIVASGVWVCEHGSQQWINDYHGYNHHPAEYPYPYTGKRLTPKRGQMYHASIIEEHGGKWWDLICSQPVIYEGARPSDKALMEIFGLWTSQGYYPRMEYYEPDVTDHSSSMPDPRTSLQWKPAVLTDEKGRAEVSFLASDVNTEFMGIVEAIDGTGLLGCQTFSFRIIRNR